jgi:hypothetical protein
MGSFRFRAPGKIYFSDRLLGIDSVPMTIASAEEINEGSGVPQRHIAIEVPHSITTETFAIAQEPFFRADLFTSRS